MSSNSKRKVTSAERKSNDKFKLGKGVNIEEIRSKCGAHLAKVLKRFGNRPMSIDEIRQHAGASFPSKNKGMLPWTLRHPRPKGLFVKVA